MCSRLCARLPRVIQYIPLQSEHTLYQTMKDASSHREASEIVYVLSTEADTQQTQTNNYS